MLYPEGGVEGFREGERRTRQGRQRAIDLALLLSSKKPRLKTGITQILGGRKNKGSKQGGEGSGGGGLRGWVLHASV